MEESRHEMRVSSCVSGDDERNEKRKMRVVVGRWTEKDTEVNVRGSPS